MDVSKLLAGRTAYMRSSEIRELLKWVTADVISFGGGMPDPSTFPTEDIAKITAYVLETYGGKALQYGPTDGVPELKEELAKFAESNGIKASSDNIIVTVGSQEALELLGRLFLDESSVVITENPTYIAALQSWRVYRPRLVGIPMDDHGMRTDVLEEQVKRLRAEGAKIKFIYTVPTAQNPTGVTLPDERRRHLLEVAERYDLLVVEDDPYGYFIFDNTVVTRLKAMDKSGRVIYLSTASKIFSPGLRLGWVIAEPEIIRWFALGKQALNLNTPTLNQYMLAEGLRRGVIQRNIPNIVSLYKRKRDAMLAALETYMPKGVAWTRPSGGMFIWVRVPEKIDTKEMLQDAVTKYKVAYVPGHGFFVDENPPRNTMRLNFTYSSFEQIDEGIRRLANAIKERI
ncbi:MAG: PLP-dependent aminotransferase family protein [Thermoproteus sp. AZ2]|jgi:2-aminoadipate transaminase|uniref:PLP-dependent aminotransferase family protein n=1 Tax=Thermoproteus sp. AZ2 TaxID=1609232 RepID=A0ACC6UYP5_9CREN|nr:MAG: aminotransferase [Thermoproteus sp. AZ2]